MSTAETSTGGGSSPAERDSVRWDDRLGDTALDALRAPAEAGWWEWMNDPLTGWKRTKVFASQVDGRLIAVMPMSGNCHYAEGLGGLWRAVAAVSPNAELRDRHESAASNTNQPS